MISPKQLLTTWLLNLIHGLVCLLSRGNRLLFMIRIGFVTVAITFGRLVTATSCEYDLEYYFTGPYWTPLEQFIDQCDVAGYFHSNNFETDCFSPGAVAQTWEARALGMSNLCASCLHNMLGTTLTDGTTTVNACINGYHANPANDGCMAEVKQMFRTECAAFAYPPSNSCSGTDQAVFSDSSNFVSDMIAACQGGLSYLANCFTRSGSTLSMPSLPVLSSLCINCIQRHWAGTIVAGAFSYSPLECLGLNGTAFNTECTQASSDFLMPLCASEWVFTTEAPSDAPTDAPTDGPSDTTTTERRSDEPTTESNGSMTMVSSLAIVASIVLALIN